MKRLISIFPLLLSCAAFGQLGQMTGQLIMPLTNTTVGTTITASILTNAWVPPIGGITIGSAGVATMYATNSIGGPQGTVYINGTPFNSASNQALAQIVTAEYQTYRLYFSNANTNGASVAFAYEPPSMYPAFTGLLDALIFYNRGGGYTSFQLYLDTANDGELNVETKGTGSGNPTTHSTYYEYPTNTPLWVCMTWNAANQTVYLNVFNETNYQLLFSCNSEAALVGGGSANSLLIGNNEQADDLTVPQSFGAVMISSNMFYSLGVTNILALSANSADVSNAIAASDPGDTVTIPAGNSTTTNGNPILFPWFTDNNSNNFEIAGTK